MHRNCLLSLKMKFCLLLCVILTVVCYLTPAAGTSITNPSDAFNCTYASSLTECPNQFYSKSMCDMYCILIAIYEGKIEKGDYTCSNKKNAKTCPFKDPIKCMHFCWFPDLLKPNLKNSHQAESTPSPV